jgi:Fe2+ transport system protein FeoA
MTPKKLSEMKPGEKSEIMSLEGGSGFKSHLRTIGLREGSKIQVIALEPARGPVVLKTGNTTLTLGRGMASKIIVK